jgi:hypothetical protein
MDKLKKLNFELMTLWEFEFVMWKYKKYMWLILIHGINFMK